MKRIRKFLRYVLDFLPDYRPDYRQFLNWFMLLGVFATLLILIGFLLGWDSRGAATILGFESKPVSLVLRLFWVWVFGTA